MCLNRLLQGSGAEMHSLLRFPIVFLISALQWTSSDTSAALLELQSRCHHICPLAADVDPSCPGVWQLSIQNVTHPHSIFKEEEEETIKR